MKKLLLNLFLILLIFTTACANNNASYKPLIGITSVYKINDSNQISLNYSYIQAVLDNGGVPIVLPAVNDRDSMKKYVQLLDGLIITGGDDIPPDAYGQIPHPATKVMPKQRYDFESAFLPLWLKSGKPTLGICLGMQFTNVVSGGTLIQDIPTQISSDINHRAKSELHEIKIKSKSLLNNILRTETALVYSNHHQSVDKVGKNLKATAQSDDGVIEALERTDGHFGLFVQWHPELMSDLKHKDAIFIAFINAASVYNKFPEQLPPWFSYPMRGPLYQLGPYN